MKANPRNRRLGSSTINSVEGRSVMARAIEITIADGRLAIHLSKADWDQAKQQLRSEAD